MAVTPDTPFALPRPAGERREDGFIEEVCTYRAFPRPKPKFHTILDANAIFGPASGETVVKTRVAPGATKGNVAVELEVRLDMGRAHLEDRLTGLADGAGGFVSGTLVRVVGEARRKEIDFPSTPWGLPDATYPEVLIPFLMRGQPFDGARRALYAWTSDRFVARVYYESRKTARVTVPAGEIEATEVWMYPDLNDWIKMGNVVTKMVKPLLPRYAMWFEAAPPHRLVRFEGSYGPPGAPEIILELVERH